MSGEVRPPLVDNPLDGVGPVRQTVAMLFYGWGYNWYRRENRLRADDLLIRSKVSDYLAEARASLASLESAYRARHLPPPTRANPLPDPAAVAQAKSLREAWEAIGAVETQVRTAPVPETDKVWQRYRAEKEVLERLALVDAALVDAAVSLAGMLAAAGPEQANDAGLPGRVRSALDRMRAELAKRSEMLRL